MLTALGHEVEVVSRFRTALRSLDETSPTRTYAKAEIRAISLIQRYRRRRIESDLWITYHPYAKAPDLLEALVATALELPYGVRSSRKDSFNVGIFKFDIDIVAEPANRPASRRGWFELTDPISRPRSIFCAPSCTCD